MRASTRSRLTRMTAAGLIIAISQSMSGCASATTAAGPQLTAEQQAAVAVAQRTVGGENAKAADFTVRSVEPRQWSDSSLGCRQRGMSYLQVISDGYVVKLESQGRLHEVHVAGENAVTCDGAVLGGPRTPMLTPRATNLDAMEREAIADLAQRLKANATDIRVTARVPQTWPDASLACSTAATTQPQSPVAGFKLVLRYLDRPYTYHTDMKRVMACPPIEAN